MARIPLEHPRTLIARLMSAYSRRGFGAVPDPGLVFMHHRGVMRVQPGRARIGQAGHAVAHAEGAVGAVLRCRHDSDAEDSRSRSNAAMGLTGQGFRDTCELQAVR